jgi:hypothetical protein
MPAQPNLDQEDKPTQTDTPQEMLKRVFAVAELIVKSTQDSSKSRPPMPDKREKTQK